MHKIVKQILQHLNEELTFVQLGIRLKTLNYVQKKRNRMKFVPRSIIGWFFIIFLTSGLIINSSSTGIIDYILMFLFSYTVVIIFSNIFSSDNSKSRNNTPNKKATPS